MKAAVVIGVAGLAMMATPAEACWLPSEVSALIHAALPDSLADDLVAVEAEFAPDMDESAFLRAGGEARILRVIRGSVPGHSIWVSPRGGRTSCDYPFANGRRGILVGRLATENGRHVIEPIWVVQRDGFRIRDRGRVRDQVGRRDPHRG